MRMGRQGRKRNVHDHHRKKFYCWYSAKQAGVKRAWPNNVMAHMWFMHDARLGRVFLFLDILAE